MSRTASVWDDLNIIAVFDVGDYVADFALYVIVGRDAKQFADDGWVDQGLLFNDADDKPVHDIKDAAPFISGHLKWDGCANVDFPELSKQNCMLHFCSRSAAGDIGRALERVYDLAGPLIPNWWTGGGA